MEKSRQGRDLLAAMVQLLATRVATRLPVRGRVLLQAPREFEPVRVARSALSDRHPSGFVELVAPDQIAHVELSESPPLLIHACKDGTDWLADWYGILEDYPGLSVVIAVEDTPCWSDRVTFDVILNHHDLVLTEVEIEDMFDGEKPIHVLRQIQRRAGGVPVLLATLLGDAEAEIPSVAETWAKRVQPLLQADPLLELMVWTGPIQASTLGDLSGRWVGSVSPAQVQQACAASIMTRVDGRSACVPEALVPELTAQMEARDPQRALCLRRLLTEYAQTERSVGIERIYLLTRIGDWAALDELLAAKQHVLIHLSAPERLALAAMLPAHPAPWLGHILHAQQFLTGTGLPTDRQPGSPSYWLELAFLFDGQSACRDKIVEQIRQWYVPSVRRGPVIGQAHVEAILEKAAIFLTANAQELFEDGATGRDDARALVAALLLWIGEVALVVGRLDRAQAWVQLAFRLGQSLGPAVQFYTVLWPSTLARLALLSAKGGASEVAHNQLREYRAVAIASERHENRIADLALRYTSCDQPGLVSQDIQEILVEEPLVAHQAEAEVLRIALLKGPAAALEWGQSMLKRASWARYPEWLWWPLHAPLALLDAREGRHDSARARLERGGLPAAIAVLVRAGIACSAGNLDEAVALIDQVRESEGLPPRWWMVATGLKIGCLAEQPDQSDQIDSLLAGARWSQELAVVVLLPERARRILLDGMEDYGGLVGLGPDHPRMGQAAEVRLTRRQIEVLQALATGQSMATIARGSYVTVETVRSTAKALYRRLGVHDRASAIEVGRVLGYVDDSA